MLLGANFELAVKSLLIAEFVSLIFIYYFFIIILRKKGFKIYKPNFIIGLNNIYLSLSNGRLLVVDIVTGKTISVLKIDNEKISRPFVLDSNLFVIKDNAIIKLN